MQNWTIQQVSAQLVYALKHKDSAEPHEETLLDLKVKFDPTAPNEMTPLIGKAILGLANIGTVNKPVYQLYRLKGDPQFTFDFDDPTMQLKSLGGSFKVAVQLSGPQGEARSFTIPYPFSAMDDKVRQQLPGALRWKYLLIRQADPQENVLAVASTGGPGDIKCDGCDTPDTQRKFQECLFNDCYSY